MYVLEGITVAEKEYYTKQPTAKQLHEKILSEAKYIPQGDKTAAAVYVAGREQAKQTAAVGGQDKVEISHEGHALQAEEQKISFSYTRIGESDKFAVQFENSAMLNRAVKQGYIEIEGQQVELSDEVKKQLLATDEQLRKTKNKIAMQNCMMHNAAVARQQGDAMKEMSDKMSRVMVTASRIMHGKKVSPDDEKELMEYDKDLYAMAKNAAALERHRRKKDDKEDERISQENDEARAREAEPKDYSVEEIEMPRTQTQMTVSLESDVPQVVEVGLGQPIE